MKYLKQEKGLTYAISFWTESLDKQLWKTLNQNFFYR